MDACWSTLNKIDFHLYEKMTNREGTKSEVAAIFSAATLPFDFPRKCIGHEDEIIRRLSEKYPDLSFSISDSIWDEQLNVKHKNVN